MNLSVRHTHQTFARSCTQGDWDASRLDEDKLARKIGSSKAARMLGLTEDQVRQAAVLSPSSLSCFVHRYVVRINGFPVRVHRLRVVYKTQVTGMKHMGQSIEIG